MYNSFVLNNRSYVFLIILIIFGVSNKIILAKETFFDLSEQEIEIQTNFNGKEVIIFGLTEHGFDTVIKINGPNKNTRVRKKERIFGFWFNTQKIIYKNLPILFFIASSSPVEKILNEDTIIKNDLYFDQMLNKLITQRNFNFSNDNKFELWNKNLIEIKKNNNFYKEYRINIVDNKLFNTKVFFPSNAIPGIYDVSIFQIKNKLIISESNKKIVIKRVGIGSKIFNFAHNEPIAYGIICILFAISSGLIAATAFRRL